jgi:hypothetical protein
LAKELTYHEWSQNIPVDVIVPAVVARVTVADSPSAGELMALTAALNLILQ